MENILLKSMKQHLLCMQSYLTHSALDHIKMHSDTIILD